MSPRSSASGPPSGTHDLEATRSQSPTLANPPLSCYCSNERNPSPNPMNRTDQRAPIGLTHTGPLFPIHSQNWGLLGSKWGTRSPFISLEPQRLSSQNPQMGMFLHSPQIAIESDSVDLKDRLTADDTAREFPVPFPKWGTQSPSLFLEPQRLTWSKSPNGDVFIIFPIARQFPELLDRFSKRLSKKIGERDGIMGKARALAAIFNSSQASNADIGAVPPPRFLTRISRAGLTLYRGEDLNPTETATSLRASKSPHWDQCGPGNIMPPIRQPDGGLRTTRPTYALYARGLRRTKLTMARMRKTTKQIWAIQAAVPAMPPKPRTAAMMATTRKTKA